MGFISHHITSLVINSLGGRHTYTHTNTHTYTNTHTQTHTYTYRYLHRNNFKKSGVPDAGWRVPGFKKLRSVKSFLV